MKQIQFDYPLKQAVLFMAFLLLYEMSAYISNDMIMPGMIQVVHSFKADDSSVAASLTAFILGGSSLQLFLGPLSDRFGRRRVMLTGVIFFIVSNIGIVFSQSISAFLGMRFFQGMGLCYIGVVGYAVVHELFNEMDAVRLISIMGNINILAPLAGPLLGAIVINLFSWRAVFILIAFTSAVAGIGLYCYMPETVNRKKKDGTFSPPASFHFKAVYNNYFSLLKNKNFLWGSIAGGVSSVPLIAWIGISPLILIKHSHLSVMQYALWQIPIFLSTTAGNFAMRYFSYRMDLKPMVLLSAKIIQTGLLLSIILLLLFREHYLCLIIGLSIYGFGLGFGSGPLVRLTLFSTSIAKGTASALQNTLMMIFTASGTQLAGMVYSSQKNLYFALFVGIYGLAYFFVVFKKFLNNTGY